MMLNIKPGLKLGLPRSWDMMLSWGGGGHLYDDHRVIHRGLRQT